MYISAEYSLYLIPLHPYVFPESMVKQTSNKWAIMRKIKNQAASACAAAHVAELNPHTKTL